jgi:hypothetical protein
MHSPLLTEQSTKQSHPCIGDQFTGVQTVSNRDLNSTIHNQLANRRCPQRKRAKVSKEKEQIIPRPQADPDGPVSFALTAELMHDWKASFTPLKSNQHQLPGLEVRCCNNFKFTTKVL